MRQADLEIGSLAGDKSLYLAPPPPQPVGGSENSVLTGSTSSELRRWRLVWAAVASIEEGFVGRSGGKLGGGEEER